MWEKWRLTIILQVKITNKAGKGMQTSPTFKS